jgi:Protein phosphatase 2C
MAFFVSIYSLPKRGLEPNENQDAFWPLLAPRQQFNAERSQEWPSPALLAAVADGATEGMFGEIWSRILASRAAHVFPDCQLDQIVEDSVRAWLRFKRRKASAGRALTRLPAWLEEPGLEQGAFSTFAAISLAEDHTWTAVAVGDSCLFHVRANELLLQWPVQASADFAKRPYLLCSAQGPSPQLADNTHSVCGRWAVDDHFFLMSDALSCWFLRKCEQGEKPWVSFLNLGTDEAGGTFQDLVMRWREADGMRNDDVTLIRVDVL